MSETSKKKMNLEEAMRVLKDRANDARSITGREMQEELDEALERVDNYPAKPMRYYKFTIPTTASDSEILEFWILYIREARDSNIFYVKESEMVELGKNKYKDWREREEDDDEGDDD